MSGGFWLVRVPPSPSIALHRPPSPFIALHRPPSPSVSLHLPPSPSISLHPSIFLTPSVASLFSLSLLSSVAVTNGLNRSFCTAHLPRSIATLTLKVDPPQGTTDSKDSIEANPSQATSEVTFESTQNSPDSKSSSAAAEFSQGTGGDSKDSTGGKGDGDGEGKKTDVKADRKRARSGKQEPQEGGSEEGEFQQLLGERRAVMGGVYAVGEGEWRATYLPHKTGLSGGWRGFALDQELDAGDAVVFEKMDPHTLKVHIFRAADFEEQALEIKSEGRSGSSKRRMKT
ncbi:unnamed protein product [Closterium sp. NIES-65]|nr:unnamed protein product [Closterium sp. NIES-65]